MSPEIKSCLNCEAHLESSQKYCSNCGQKVKEAKIPLKEFLSDFLGDYFTFDSKLFRSVFPLIFRPGFLTKEYINGRRMSYIPPFRVFIFTTIIFFFFFGLNENSDSSNINFNNSKKNTDSIAETIPLISGINEYVSKSDSLEEANKVDSTKNEASINFGDDLDFNFDSDTLKYLASIGKLEPYLDENTKEMGFISRFVTKQVGRIIGNQAKDFVTYFISAFSKVIFLALPFFAFLLWLFYRAKKHYYFEVFIFSLHFYTFVFLSWLILIWIELLFDINLYGYLFVIYFFYFLISLKNIFGESWKSTFAKQMGFSVLFGIFFVPFFIIALSIITLILY